MVPDRQTAQDRCTVPTEARQSSELEHKPPRAFTSRKVEMMTDVNVNERSETFTRLIGRLSMEINQLTRVIPLREGRLLELEAQSPSDCGAVLRVAQEIRTARHRLQEAEVDLVELERLVVEYGKAREAH